MSTNPPSRTPTTLAEVIEQIAARDDLLPHRRSEFRSAIRVICSILGQSPSDLDCWPEVLRPRLCQITAAETGLSPGRLRNVRSLLNSALMLTGVTSTGSRSREVMSGEWKELLDRISDRYDRAKLTRLARYCSQRGLTPDQVADDIIAAFGDMLLRRSSVERPKQILRDTCLTWNRLIERINGWPATRLKVPSNKRTYAMALDGFPTTFADDLQAYLRHLAGKDLFSETARAPASAVTIRNQHIWLLELASALVLSGRDAGSIRSLSDLVEIDAAKAALGYFWQRNGQRKTGQLHNFARLIVNIAKHWVKVLPAHLEALQALRRQVDPGKGGLTERNRARLRVFADPVNIERLVNLPESIIKPIRRLANPKYNEGIRVQSALAIAIQLVAPLRPKNLAGLALDRHFVRTRLGRGAVVHLVIPAGEVKNRTPLEFELPPDVVHLLDFYVEKIRPLLITVPSPCLFPARKGGAKTPAQLAEQMKRAIRAGTGLTVNAHMFRHFAAFLYLKAHPGDYESVRLLLGHRELTTTVRAYCGLERSDAIRRYDNLIDGYRRSEDRPHAD